MKADIEGEFMRVVDSVPRFAERARCGRREERFYESADLPSFLRRPFGRNGLWLAMQAVTKTIKAGFRGRRDVAVENLTFRKVLRNTSR